MSKSRIITILLTLGILTGICRVGWVLYNRAPSKQSVVDVKKEGISSKEGKELYQLYTSYISNLKDTMSDEDIKRTMQKRYHNSKDYRKNLINSIAKENFDLSLEDLNTITEEVYNIIEQ